MVARWVRISPNRVWELSRDFRIARPLVIESELGFPNQVPAFWSCANKVMTCLLFQARHTDGHGVRPHSLMVTTIFTLMTEVIKGNANLSQLATQGDYLHVAAQDMAKAYSRNLAHRQIFVSHSAQKAFQGNRNVDAFKTAPPEISEECQAGENPRTPSPNGKNRPIWRSPF